MGECDGLPSRIVLWGSVAPAVALVVAAFGEHVANSLHACRFCCLWSPVGMRHRGRGVQRAQRVLGVCFSGGGGVWYVRP